MPAPLILVVLGIGVSLLPFVPVVTAPPELVLAVVLPPLLYSSSVSVPAMDLRRELGAVSLLSVALVVVSALVLGRVFTLLVPGLAYSWGVALGAVVSPTDAVATSVVKRAGVSPRITAILEGESLLNDASALVLLRAAITGAATAVSVGGVVGDFLAAVALAVLVGVVVGRVALLVRARVSDPTVNTVISFTVPFLASLPAEVVGGSGLVAAVAAGLVVGRRGPRVLGPQHRRSDQENWATVSLVLEGAVFLLMGLEIAGILADAGGPEVAVRALGLAAVALVAVTAIRAAFVAPLLASIDHLAAHPLGPREGAVVVWAGMRGAVTVAAAQTLPTGAEGPEERSLLVLVAFGVAAISLLVQGGTLSLLVRWLRLASGDPEAAAQERREVVRLVRDVRASVAAGPGGPAEQHRSRQVRVARGALLDARDLGVHDSAVLGAVLEALDAEEVALELRGGPAG